VVHTGQNLTIIENELQFSSKTSRLPANATESIKVDSADLSLSSRENQIDTHVSDDQYGWSIEVWTLFYPGEEVACENDLTRTQGIL